MGGDTVGSILQGFKGPGDSPTMATGSGGGDFTPSAFAGASSPSKDELLGYQGISTGTPYSGAPATPAATPTSPPTNPQASDAYWKQIQSGLNIANGVAQTARGLQAELSQGAPASPLMPRSVGGGMPYQPSAKNRPMTLSELLARR